MSDSNQERFELLYRQHFRAVLRYALARLEPERAKDVAAETFLIAWRRIEDVPGEPAAWFFGVARKVIADQLRADGRRDALTARLAVARGRDDGPADPADQVASATRPWPPSPGWVNSTVKYSSSSPGTACPRGWPPRYSG